MPKFRKKPIEVEAVRYGKEENGSWYSEAVYDVARFMWGYDGARQLTEVEVVDVLRPTGLWDPPENAELEMWDGVAHGKWLPLTLGDWVIKGVNGEFYPCKPDIFEATHEQVNEEGES